MPLKQSQMHGRLGSGISSLSRMFCRSCTRSHPCMHPIPNGGGRQQGGLQDQAETIGIPPCRWCLCTLLNSNTQKYEAVSTIAMVSPFLLLSVGVVERLKRFRRRTVRRLRENTVRRIKMQAGSQYIVKLLIHAARQTSRIDRSIHTSYASDHADGGR